MVLNVGILRAGDLEARELAVFDRLASTGFLHATAIGDVPSTPYGITGLDLDVRILPSVTSRLARVPLGETVVNEVHRRFSWRPPAHSQGLGKGLRPFDIVNVRETFHDQSARAASFVTGGSGQRLVVSCAENVPFRYEEDPSLARNKDQVRASGDLFIANSPGAQSALELEGVPTDLIRLIPPAIDTDRFAPGPGRDDYRTAWGAMPDEAIVLYAGRLQAEKGLAEFIVATHGVLRAGGVRLVINGAGPERPRIERIVSALELDRSVSFAPWATPAEMPDVYRSADVVVLPSLTTPYWREQFGYNLAEAMACGRAVVAADTGEIPWVLGDAGLTYPVAEAQAAYASLRLLVEDVDRRQALGAAARAAAVRRFSIEVAGRDLADAFEEAHRSPPRTQ